MFVCSRKAVCMRGQLLQLRLLCDCFADREGVQPCQRAKHGLTGARNRVNMGAKEGNSSGENSEDETLLSWTNLIDTSGCQHRTRGGAVRPTATRYCCSSPCVSWPVSCSLTLSLSPSRRARVCSLLFHQHKFLLLRLLFQAGLCLPRTLILKHLIGQPI